MKPELKRPAEGPISKGYGQWHKAIDIAADVGQPVVAMHAGRIKHMGYDTNGRGYTIIMEGDGQTSVYAHLSSFSVHGEQWIEKGQEIGQVGNTGAKTTGAHLHVEYIRNGQYEDPSKYW